MKLKRNFTNNDLETLLTSNIHDKYKLALIIGFFDGLRLSEILALQVCDLELDNNLYRLKKQKNGLLFASRYMCNFVKYRLIEYLDLYKKEIEDNDGHIIFTRIQRRKPINKNTFCQTLRRWQIKLGILRIQFYDKQGHGWTENSFHGTRKRSINNFVSDLLEAGEQPSPVGLMLHAGWKNISSAQAYLQKNDEMVQANGRIRERL